MAIDDRNTHSPSDPNFRWQGQRTDGDKSPEAAARARKNQFKTVEEFAAWRRSKGFPEISYWDLVFAWGSYKGEEPGEQAALNPVLEHR
jgi:hypothetical protein